MRENINENSTYSNEKQHNSSICSRYQVVRHLIAVDHFQMKNVWSMMPFLASSSKNSITEDSHWTRAITASSNQFMAWCQDAQKRWCHVWHHQTAFYGIMAGCTKKVMPCLASSNSISPRRRTTGWRIFDAISGIIKRHFTAVYPLRMRNVIQCVLLWSKLNYEHFLRT